MGQDLRYAARGLLRAKGFTAAAILCLALGTGATAAIFSIVNAFLFRPLPVVHPENLVVIGSLETGQSLPGDNSYPDYLEMRAQHGAFQDAVAHQVSAMSVRMGDRSDRRIVDLVSENYWPMLGVHMARGRGFTAAEALTRSPEIVISYRLWQQEFAGANDVIGRAMAVNGVALTIVGVAPPAFQGLSLGVPRDAWVPVTLFHELEPGDHDPMVRPVSGGFRVMARLQPGVSAEAAQRALDVLARQLGREYPTDDNGMRFLVKPELRSRPDIAVADTMPRVAIVFGALTALVLLIACANVASLMLARVSGRYTELAVRVALGAGRTQLIRQMLAESVVLATAGAVVGVGFAVAVVHWATTIPFAFSVPIGFDLPINGRVLAVTAAAAMASAMLSGLGPAFRASNDRRHEGLRESARGSAGGIARQRFRIGLVGGQVAVSFVLLVTAGLFLRSVQRATRANLGFRQDHIFLATVDVSLARYDSAQGVHFFRTLLDRASQISGVRAAALASAVLLGDSHHDIGVFADLPTLVQEKGRTSIEVTTITPRYFEVMGIPVLDGRAFTQRDDSTAPRVMVINAAAARRLWPGQSAVGQQVRLEAQGQPVQIVGVVGTVTSALLGEQPSPMVYLPLAQSYNDAMTLHLWTAGEPGQLAGPVRDVVNSIDANVTPYAMMAMAVHLRYGLAFVPVRLAAAIASGIGLVGLVLAIIGLYGVIAYSVAQRHREIGIRMALGATSGDILRGVLREGMIVTGAGLAVGLALALSTTRVLGSLLIDVGARDPATFVVLAAGLVGVAVVACAVPAWRASTIPPAQVVKD